MIESEPNTLKNASCLGGLPRETRQRHDHRTPTRIVEPSSAIEVLTAAGESLAITNIAAGDIGWVAVLAAGLCGMAPKVGAVRCSCGSIRSAPVFFGVQTRCRFFNHCIEGSPCSSA